MTQQVCTYTTVERDAYSRHLRKRTSLHGYNEEMLNEVRL